MDVRMFWNTSRPGVGLKPRRESQRPQLPQQLHARHCPVLEASSGLGFLVYPPLEPFESFFIGHYGEGRYQFVYYFQSEGADWVPIFTVRTALPVGGIGKSMQEVEIKQKDVQMSREDALLLMCKFVVPDDLGTPPGAVTLRGARNFRTPPGVDTVYTGVFNAIERPAPPVMVVRVETDWYMHETEFRDVLQPGEGISAVRTMPIGQVFFVPREEIALLECTVEELEEMRIADKEFGRAKEASQVMTPYGIPYSPHYLKESRPAKGAEGVEKRVSGYGRGNSSSHASLHGGFCVAVTCPHMECIKSRPLPPGTPPALPGYNGLLAGGAA